MNSITGKFIVALLYFIILLRPSLPTIAYELNKLQVNASSLQHSWLVQQLLQEVEKEKNKYAEAIRTSIETTTIAAPELQQLFLSPVAQVEDIKITLLGDRISDEFIFSIFHPPRL